MKSYFLTLGLLASFAATAHSQSLNAEVDKRAAAVNDKVIAWRRDIHANPELGNHETRTAKLVADHLRALGMEVQTGVAHTGVVGILKGGKPGKVVALRADMDALPVTEQVELPFASKVRTTYNGQEVGVMHACGHDTHVAMLMGVAEVLAGMRQNLRGTVKFIFQPAEEGLPGGEIGGAKLMLDEGAFNAPSPDAVFGLHIFAGQRVGTIQYRANGYFASADELRITVRGKQTHGAKPWGGNDPIVASAQIITALQTIVSRQLNLTTAPAIVTIGAIHGGVRNNIIPDSVVMIGTLRALDMDMRDQIHVLVRRTAEDVAAAMGANAEVDIHALYPVTKNDPALTAWAVPTLERVFGKANVVNGSVEMGAEDFSFFANKVPGLYLKLGGTPASVELTKAASNHSPLFFADESALPLGVRAMANLAVDYLQSH